MTWNIGHALKFYEVHQQPNRINRRYTLMTTEVTPLSTQK